MRNGKFPIYYSITSISYVIFIKKLISYNYKKSKLFYGLDFLSD